MTSSKPQARHRRACRPATPLTDLTNTKTPVRSMAFVSATGVALSTMVPAVATAAELTSLDLNDSKEVLVTDETFQAEANPSLEAPANLEWAVADQVAFEVVTAEQVEELEKVERERAEREREEARVKEAERIERENAANRSHQREALENPAPAGQPVAAAAVNNTGYNAYPWGQCTWGAKTLAPWAGNNWGNAAQWAWSASAQGFRTGTVPQVGAIAVWSGNHVAVVVDVQSDSSIRVMEANWAGNSNIGDYRGFFDPRWAQGQVTYIYPN